MDRETRGEVLRIFKEAGYSENYVVAYLQTVLVAPDAITRKTSIFSASPREAGMENPEVQQDRRKFRSCSYGVDRMPRLTVAMNITAAGNSRKKNTGNWTDPGPISGPGKGFFFELIESQG